MVSSAGAVFHAAAPSNRSFQKVLNIAALPNVISGRQKMAEQVSGIAPVFSAKGWLSLNWFRSCQLNCAYCYRQSRQDESGFGIEEPVKLYDERFVVDFLLSHPYFEPKIAGQASEFNPSVIGLHTSSTEPFKGEVKESTLRLLELLNSKNISNPVVIITKWYLKEKDIEWLESNIRNLSLYISICYSSMPREIEPVSTPEIVAKKRTFLERLMQSPTITPVHYMRPIGLGWNDSDEQIRSSLDFSRGVPGIVAGGVTLWSNELDLLRQAGIKEPQAPECGWIDYGYRRKLFPKTTEEHIIAIRDGMGIDTPFFRRASCVYSHLMGVPDYNAYRTEDHKNCTRACPAGQVELCESVKKPAPEKVERALSKMGIEHRPFIITDHAIEMTAEDDKFGLLDAFALRHLLGFPVIIVKKLPEQTNA